jgi:hypothetical protein
MRAPKVIAEYVRTYLEEESDLRFHRTQNGSDLSNSSVS